MKKLIKPQHFIIPYHVYPFDLYVSINERKEKLVNDLRKILIKKDGKNIKEFFYGFYEARTAMLSGGQTIIHIPNFKNEPSGTAIVAHESFHAAEFLFKRINIEHDMCKSGEAYAYLIGYIVRNIYNNIKGL